MIQKKFTWHHAQMTTPIFRAPLYNVLQISADLVMMDINVRVLETVKSIPELSFIPVCIVFDLEGPWPF